MSIDIHTQYKICKKIDNYTECIKLDLNEFDYTHQEELYNTLTNSLTLNKGITHYSNFYNIHTANLLKSLANYENINENDILLSAGSDDSLEYITNAFINKNTNVLIFVPSYNYFELLVKRKTKNITYIYLPINNEIIDLYYVLEFYKDLVQVIYIVNPNNPLGTLINKEHIKDMLSNYPNILFIIDEAYIEFCKNNSCVYLTKIFDNIIITRTFSKAYGIAGMRLGYTISSNQIISKLKVLYNEKNVTDLAKIAGNYIITNKDYYLDIINQINIVRFDFENFLENLNIYYIKSQANFVSFFVGQKYYKLLNILEKYNIYIRDRNEQFNMKGFVRITIGTPKHINIIKNIILDNISLFEFNPIVKYFTNKNFIWKLKYLLKQLLEIIDCKFDYWLDGGSLLGCTRNNGIIPYDNDIDICMKSIDIPNLISLEKKFIEKGIRLKRNRTDCYYQVDFLADGDGFNTNDIHIDIFTLDNNLITTDPRYKNKDPDNFQCNIQYTYDLLYPLRKDLFYNLNIYIPNYNKKLLVSALGDNCIQTGKILNNDIENITDYTCA